MTTHKLANFVAWFHMFWILLLLSGFLGVWLPWWRTPHLCITSATIISQIVFMGCPLVLIESKLRGTGNTGSFTAYFIEKWIGVKINAWAVTVGLIVVFIGALLLQIEGR